jgi:hypothetical protein
MMLPTGTDLTICDGQDPCDDPNFTEFLCEALNSSPSEVNALLGRWMVEYRPQASYDIQVLKPVRSTHGHADAAPETRLAKSA